MTAVIDEGVPRDLVRLLRDLGVQIEAFPNDWKGLQNGKLLALVEATGFSCLVTSDRNMRWQQSVAGRAVAIFVLPGQKLIDLVPRLNEIADGIAAVQPGRIFALR